VDIHRARAFTIKKDRPVILDTLWTRSNGTQISESRARKIRTSLRDVLSGSKTVAQFLEQAGKTPPDSIALDSIRLRNDLSEEHTVANIVAPDLQGLLYLISRGLSRCGVDIHSAKVATWRGLCENNFYVTSPTGSQIPDRDLPVWTDLIAHVLSGGGDESPNQTQ
jgi:UTP:GlnB (protein PII) uridylyltransferase